MKVIFTIDGTACTTFSETIAEFNRVFADQWRGHLWTGNLDSFHDLLSWIDGGRACSLVWKHADAAREGLGYPATATWLQDKVHVSAVGSDAAKAWRKELTAAQHRKGQTLFDRLTELIEAAEHIHLDVSPNLG